jgi:acetyltransferase-like isoleucine patch superfamily enzyme
MSEVAKPASRRSGAWAILRAFLGDLRIHARRRHGWLVQSAKGVRVASSSSVHPDAVIEAPASFAGRCRVGGLAEVGAYTYASDSILENCTIGRFCSIGPGVKIGLNEHPLDRVSTSPWMYDAEVFNASLRRTVIGHDVWIGANAVVLCGVVVGHGCVIAAGSVVRSDVEDFTIVGGVPARVIGRRVDDRSFVDAVRSATDSSHLRLIADEFRDAVPVEPTMQTSR